MQGDVTSQVGSLVDPCFFNDAPWSKRKAIGNEQRRTTDGYVVNWSLPMVRSQTI